MQPNTRSFYTIGQEITSKLARVDRSRSRFTKCTAYSAEIDLPKWIVQARTALDGEAVGHRIVFYRSIPSTMSIARQIMDTSGDAAAGTVVIADEQTAGRGRMQRHWQAVAGRGLLSSYLLCADLLPDRPSLLVMIAGLALLKAVRQCCPQLEQRLHLKWPNDVIVMESDGPLKLAGILVESIFHEEKLSGAVLGIGVNVNQREDELPSVRNGSLPPSSLALVGKQPSINRGDLLVALCQALGHLCAPRSRPPAEAIHAQWESALAGLGSVVACEDGPRSGRAIGTSLQGALLVRGAKGEIAEVRSGDVTFHWNTRP